MDITAVVAIIKTFGLTNPAVILVGLIAFLVGKGYIKTDKLFKKKEVQDKPKACNFHYALGTVRNLTKEMYEYLTKAETEIVRRQMNYTEDRLSEIKIQICEDFADKLKTKLTDEEDKIHYKSHIEFRSFQMLLNSAFDRITKENLMKSFKENGLSDYDEMAWERFKSHKSDLFYQRIQEHMDLMYIYDKLITRIELDEVFNENEIELKRCIKDCYEMARTISIKEYDKLTQMKKIYESSIDKLIRSNECNPVDGGVDDEKDYNQERRKDF